MNYPPQSPVRPTLPSVATFFSAGGRSKSQRLIDTLKAQLTEGGSSALRAWLQHFDKNGDDRISFQESLLATLRNTRSILQNTRNTPWSNNTFPKYACGNENRV